MTTFAVIAGGGTSGHVLPALAVAESLVDAGHSLAELEYFGARRGVETRLVPPSGLRAEFFDVVGLKREISVSALVNNLLFAPKLLRAWWRAVRHLRRSRPRVVVSVGGYASLPAVLGARVLKIPIVVVTYDRTPGRSSALTSRFAAAVASAFPEGILPRSEYTGAPVRRALRNLDREAERASARRRLGLEADRFCIGVIGGSLGSGILNDVTLTLVRHWASDPGVAIRHVVGGRFLETHRQRLIDTAVSFDDGTSTMDERGGLHYQIIGYEEDMTSMYAAVDVIVGRGGAGTVAEVAVTGTPAVLIPWSGSADDHQRANVAWLADEGGALAMDETVVARELPHLLDELRRDPNRLHSLGHRAHEAGARSRLGAIADLVERVAAEGSS
ncbi:MAG: UDP-N-acetylglucosamine--N-acetylmuramyl-(pentapeptide) pyrophosphoryl-undecaprenol N-acetylglucosamine transferase [Actinomycetota bacterium]